MIMNNEATPHLTKTLLSKVINLLVGSEESSERSWSVAAGGFNLMSSESNDTQVENMTIYGDR